MTDRKIYACIDYEDAYVQPLLLAALKARLPPELLVFINNTSALPSPSSRLLQWRQYESIDFDHLLSHSTSSLANSYIIRKALIRKHYLSTTLSNWLTKYPDSLLGKHVKPAVEFEVDYAEFLEDALVEAWELRKSWARNESRQARDEKGKGETEWWILKPGMSERGQGIRLFSSEEELTAIFEEWDAPSSEDDEAEDDEVNSASKPAITSIEAGEKAYANANGIITSQLRHFIAQPYITNPLLLPPPHPSANRKFHIRTYVLALGALRVHVSKSMLALFAAAPYCAPSASASETSPNEALSRHLTNTCLQTGAGERERSVHAFWSLPQLPQLSNWREQAFEQICAVTAEVFEAAARTMSVHFQPLPNAFEIFGLDFLVDEEGTAWLLEVNAFPDFAQTGAELRGLVEGLFGSVVDVGVKPFFGLDGERVESVGGREGHGEMVKVLDIDLGRR